MRVNPATIGTVDLIASATDMIELQSRDYGLYVNQINVVLAAATNNGKKLTVSFQSEDDEVFDDMYRESFTIEYTAGACTMTIVNNSGTQTLATSAGAFVTPIDLNAYPTLGELATYIDGTADYDCTVIAGQENASSLEIDAVTAQDINTTPYTAQSTFQAIIDTIVAGSARLTAVANNGANDRVIPDNLTQTFLTGGAEGTYDATAWTNALTALEAEDIHFISTPDPTAAYHASIKTHCETMSAVTGRRERQFLVGEDVSSGTLATDITAAQGAAQTLNSKNGMLVFNGGTQRDINGVVQTYSASYVACMLMGQKIALAINQPLTFKELNLIELEHNLSDSSLENLLKEGVAAVNYAPNGVPRMVRQFNTYQTNDLKWNEFSVVTEMFFVSRDLRVYLESLFIGQPGTAITGGVLRGAVEGRLATYTDLGIFITHPTENRSWWNVVINISGDIVYIDYDAYVTLPVNFEFITNHFHEMVASL
jgi:hypothetical protein